MRIGSPWSVSLSLPRTARSSLHQLSDIADGLNYLHLCDIIHGGLKGVRDCVPNRDTSASDTNQSNILVDASGHARITDFTLAATTENPDLARSASSEYGRGVRWTAPEILGSRETYSKEADVFSFGMVTIEVCGGQPTLG